MNIKKSVLQMLFGFIIGTFGFGGCENAKETIGLAKQAPDEFAVVTRAPLNIPPKFDLRPPKLGAKRPQKVTPTSKARTILLRKNSLREKTEKTMHLRNFAHYIIRRMQKSIKPYIEVVKYINSISNIGINAGHDLNLVNLDFLLLLIK